MPQIGVLHSWIEGIEVYSSSDKCISREDREKNGH